MSARILAAVDVGSNSVRLMIASVDGERVSIMKTHRAATRLLGGIQNGVLAGEAVERTAGAVAEMYDMARAAGAERIDAFGTSALRDAVNRESFSDCVHALCGLRVRVISGEEEAQLAYAGAASASGKRGVIDIGGGSTELIVGVDGRALRAHSAQAGAVRMFNELNGRENPEEMCLWARERLQNTVDMVCTEAPDRWIGVGGSITTLAAMTGGVERYFAGAVDNFPLTEKDVEGWLLRLCSTPVEQRRSLVGLAPQRADIIGCGAAILLTVMRMARIGTIYACDHDNLEGYIRLYMLSSLQT